MEKSTIALIDSVYPYVNCKNKSGHNDLNILKTPGFIKSYELTKVHHE
jgi:hypothetical protein